MNTLPDEKFNKEFVLAPVWMTVVKKYQPIKLIGKGSYGDVVEALDLNTHQRVAIKYISNCDNAEYASVKTLREIQILRILTEIPQNKHVVKILDLMVPD